jgi:hypothetical protein
MRTSYAEGEKLYATLIASNMLPTAQKFEKSKYKGKK